MQLAGHEAYHLHELVLGSANMVTTLSYFVKHVQDAELKSIMARQYRLHIQDYNLKVEYMQNPEGPRAEVPVPPLNPVLESFTESPVAHYTPYVPRADIQQFSDREIATSYLLALKRSGRETSWAALETANPSLRCLLEDGFVMNSHHAYEIWEWMVKHGYYPLQPASSDILNTVEDMYSSLDQPQPTGIH